MATHVQDAIAAEIVAMLRGIVLLLDASGRIKLCNPFFEEFTGYSADEVLGRDWFETFIPEVDREEIRRLFATVMQAGMNDGYTNPIVIKSGEQRLIEWHSKTIEDENRQIAGILCTGYDVTDREAYARELAIAKQQADRATASKSRFLTAASHDLRQPLQSLAIYLSALSKQSDRPGTLALSRKMRQSLDTARDLLDALLDIAKLENGQIEPSKRDFSLRELLDRIVTNNRPQAESKGLALSCNAGEHVVHSDPVLLERIIENLVTNAVKYTEVGHVAVDAEIHDGVARITVADTGIGIPEDRLDRVFDEYYQVDRDSGTMRSGLGLGLAIVKQFAQLLDHRLDVTSAPGKGSCFAIDVPLGKSPKLPDEKSPLPTRPTAIDPQTVVLMVDDDPEVLDALTMLLETEGAEVHGAPNGDAALSRIEAGLRPDVVVSDYRMPGCSGLEFVQRVRNTTTNDVPVILMTGDTSAHEIASARLPNCTVLHKPFDEDQFLSLIASIKAQ